MMMPDYTTQGQINGALRGTAGRSQEQYPEQRRFVKQAYENADIGLQSGLGTKLSADRHKSDLEIATDHLTQVIELLQARSIGLHEKLRSSGLLTPGEPVGAMPNETLPGVQIPTRNTSSASPRRSTRRVGCSR
jgi:hypothetical protein